MRVKVQRFHIVCSLFLRDSVFIPRLGFPLQRVVGIHGVLESLAMVSVLFMVHLKNLMGKGGHKAAITVLTHIQGRCNIIREAFKTIKNL